MGPILPQVPVTEREGVAGELRPPGRAPAEARHRVFFPARRDLPDSLPRRLADALLNLIYPENCLCCPSPVSRWHERGVCDGCWSKILQMRIGKPWCPSCGMPYEAAEMGESHLCGACILRPPPFAGARSFGTYSGELRGVIHAFKFRGRKDLAFLLAPLLASAYGDSWGPGDFDLLVPVPLHRTRKRERGYNQSALLGRLLAGLIGIPCSERVLARLRATPPQVGFSAGERMKNLRGAFRCLRPGLVSRRRLLLVDDVMTTGATLSGAAAALLEAGAQRVSALTLARTVPDRE